MASAWRPWRWRAATGVVAWALLTGFVEHEAGVLTLAPPDLVRLALAALGLPLLAGLLLRAPGGSGGCRGPGASSYDGLTRGAGLSPRPP